VGLARMKAEDAARFHEEIVGRFELALRDRFLPFYGGTVPFTIARYNPSR
jgi:hypothetical protein